MGQSAVKNPKKIFSQAGADPALNNRVTNLENNEYKILYFEAISSTTGTITKPTGATILLDQFYSGGDALVETLSNGQPTGQSPLTIGGAVVSVTSFDTSGNYVLSGTPSAYPIALVYIFKIKAIDLPNLNMTNIMQMDANGYVPYLGAITDLDLGEFGIQLGNLEFDNTPTNIPTTAGSVVWNDTDGTLDLMLKGGNVTLQIGQETVIRVVNKTATNVTLLQSNYQAVRITGAQGLRPKVDLAQATNDILSAETIGLVTETIANNQEGFITTSGLVRGINTTGSLQSETWADGDILYLSTTTAGNITKVKPTAPNHLIVIGYVIHAHITQGTIFVKVDNGYELDELHNVYVNPSTLANNDLLTYESSSQLWKNKQITIQTELTNLTYSGSYRPAKIGYNNYASTTAYAAVTYFYKIEVGSVFNCVSLSAICTTLAAASNIRMCLYNGTETPTTPISGTDTGNLSCATTGLKEGTITATSIGNSGCRWVALQVSSTSIGLRTSLISSNNIYLNTDKLYYSVGYESAVFGTFQNNPTLTGLNPNSLRNAEIYLKVQ